jgi:hypothetical protein
MKTQQMSLFGGPRPTPPVSIPHNGTRTSIAAAQSKRGSEDVNRRAVLEFLTQRGSFGATDDEMQHFLNMEGSTQRPRRIKLCEEGLAGPKLYLESCTAMPVERPTRKGRMAQVWVLTEFMQSR